ncbi:hypothetical protein SETIT_4G239900v2 [Setaria italica]|uniref:Uncharacterized protein n=1 Tax=Setaria italica TaxID=4555 RepID=A0A368QXL7_SETIT|nr:hypothetical protein SETIT_4G239900v2 [Setaria italica]
MTRTPHALGARDDESVSAWKKKEIEATCALFVLRGWSQLIFREEMCRCFTCGE